MINAAAQINNVANGTPALVNVPGQEHVKEAVQRGGVVCPSKHHTEHGTCRQTAQSFRDIEERLRSGVPYRLCLICPRAWLAVWHKGGLRSDQWWAVVAL